MRIHTFWSYNFYIVGPFFVQLVVNSLDVIYQYLAQARSNKVVRIKGWIAVAVSLFAYTVVEVDSGFFSKWSNQDAVPIHNESALGRLAS